MEFKRALVVHEQCGVCDYVREKLTEKGVSFEVIDASTREGYEKAEKLGIKSIPNCVVITRDGDKEEVRACTDEELKEFIGEMV